MTKRREGLDAATALYEWNYSKQLLHIKLQEATAATAAEKEAAIFSEPFLLKRPLLEAITHLNAPHFNSLLSDRASVPPEAVTPRRRSL